MSQLSQLGTLKMKTRRYGMVGGKSDHTVGGKHRQALGMLGNTQLCAGCFSRDTEENLRAGTSFGVDPSRIYGDYAEMAERESRREDRPDFVSIVTPNASHYEIARCFLEHGFHVMCEKPLALSLEDGEKLALLAREKNLRFGLMHTYSGHNALKIVRKMIREKKIGDILDIKAEYLQNWILPLIKDPDADRRIWRMNPEITGSSNCVGDIGSHVEEVIHYVTGLHPRRVLGVLDRYGHALEVNANILVEFENGVHGNIAVSQVAEGYYDGLSVRIFGTEGSLAWSQTACNEVRYTPKGQPTQIIQRGMAGAGELPDGRYQYVPGQPEGLIQAFENNYAAFLSALDHEVITEDDFDYPHIEAGLWGLRFIRAVQESAADQAGWRSV